MSQSDAAPEGASTAAAPAQTHGETHVVAAYLDMPADRRAAAEAHAALLGATAGRVAAELPFNADVDDFRRVLVAEANS